LRRGGAARRLSMLMRPNLVEGKTLSGLQFSEKKKEDPLLRAQRFICLQIGARENYAVARALHRRGALAVLITDIWAAHAGPVKSLSRNLADRGHDDLAEAPVISDNFGAMSREGWASVRGSVGWPRVMARNRWFQDMAVRRLGRLGISDGDVTIFAYSYAARKIFAYARQRGWHTVLGQIDPGPGEERIVAKEHQAHPDLAPKWTPAPEAYWQAWREEVALADRIIVNSDWSRQALLAEGISTERMDVIPLAYEPPPEAVGFRRCYPPRFNATRPLRVLFLGQVNLRKGVGPLLDAARLLEDAPVEFRFVGPLQIAPPNDLASDPRVAWHGPAARSDVHLHYRNADILLFPTLSDGFGLTQLEARAWRLPIIVTRRCGDVVEDGVTGIVVEPGDPKAIAEAIQRCINAPDWLQLAADAIAPGERHDIDRLGKSLAAIA
jgi:glycosyltransferase involved in cell wall biosynthesis